MFDKIGSMKVLSVVAFFLAISLALLSSGGTAFAQDVQKRQPVEGAIRVSGAWALYPMMVKWADEFKKIHPNVRIDISAGGAGKGVADALSGLVDIGMVSRALRPEEIRQKVFYVPVVKDAVFPTVNAGNPVMKELLEKGLQKKDFVAMWIAGRTLTWGELTGTLARQKIRVYTRSDSCGAAETWAEYLGAHQEDLKGIAVYGDPGLAEAVRRDKTGIGYNNLNFAYDMNTGQPLAGLRIVPVDVNENGRIDPEEKLHTKPDAIAAVESGVYPSPPARDLYVVTKESFRGPAKAFVRWILTDGQQYAAQVGYLRVEQKQLEIALKKINR
ncbi:MAG: PstS family phosphate ABC transporter substrate-binding protein [Smithellaceae bacterium]